MENKGNTLLYITDYYGTITRDTRNLSDKKYDADQKRHFELIADIAKNIGCKNIIYSVVTREYIEDILRIMKGIAEVAEEKGIDFDRIYSNCEYYNRKSDTIIKYSIDCVPRKKIVLHYISEISMIENIKCIIFADDNDAQTTRDHCFNELKKPELPIISITPNEGVDIQEGFNFSSDSHAIEGSNVALTMIRDLTEKHKGAFNKSIFK